MTVYIGFLLKVCSPVTNSTDFHVVDKIRNRTEDEKNRRREEEDTGKTDAYKEELAAEFQKWVESHRKTAIEVGNRGEFENL